MRDNKKKAVIQNQFLRLYVKLSLVLIALRFAIFCWYVYTPISSPMPYLLLQITPEINLLAPIAIKIAAYKILQNQWGFYLAMWVTMSLSMCISMVAAIPIAGLLYSAEWLVKRRQAAAMRSREH